MFFQIPCVVSSRTTKAHIDISKIQAIILKGSYESEFYTIDIYLTQAVITLIVTPITYENLLKATKMHTVLNNVEYDNINQLFPSS
jgi:hypothetical protein